MKKLGVILIMLLSVNLFSQSFVWGKRGGNSGSLITTIRDPEGVRSIVTDSQKNIYVLSNVGAVSLNFDGVPDTAYADGNTKMDVALVSFACDGTFRWSKIIGGGGYEDFQNLVIDNQDNVYLAGRFGGSSALPYGQHIHDDVTIPSTPEDRRRLVLFKYNSNGQLQWYKRPEPPTVPIEGTLAKGSQIDSEGNIHWLVYLTPGTYIDGALTVSDSAKP